MSRVHPQEVVATITLDDGTVTSAGGNTHTFTANGSFTFKFADSIGNTGSAVADVDWIDKIAPTATFTYSIMAPTNQDVVATLVPSEEVTVTNNEGSATRTFVENDEFTFEFVDAAGNTGSATAAVNNIDKTISNYEITYNPATLTNQDVVATVTLDDGTVTSEGGNTRTFAENGSFTFEFTDSVGNTGSAVADVDWIDKTAPTATFTYSIMVPTNQDVVATLVADEAVTVANNGGLTTRTFIENGEFMFEFVDTAGNTGSSLATVSNIDRIAPTAELIGAPMGISYTDSIEITIAGTDVTHYKCRLDDEDYRPEADIGMRIQLRDLSEGYHTLNVIGCDDAENWQTDGNATRITWEVRFVDPGDLNDDGEVNLADVILAMQVVIGIEHNETVYRGADVDGDGRIGMEEVAYSLHRVIGLR